MNEPFKILVVEDESDFKVLIRQRFRSEIKEGIYTFIFAGHGQEALKLLEEHPDIDLVLSDINMPVMDGLALLSHLRQHRPELITVIISAYGDMPKIRTAMNLGAFDFVIKPFNFADLKATIQKTIRESELIRQAAKARELELLNEQLRQIDRMKTQFLTNVSHEFRTPVTVIDGMADQILAKPDRWLKRGVELIKRNSAHLIDLVDQVLDLTKLDDGSMKLNLVRDDIVSYLRQMTESFQGMAERKQIQLTFVENLPKLTMDYDPDKLKRVLANLLSNAIKFNEFGGEARVEVHSDLAPDQSGWLVLTVKDDGFGIPPDQQAFIFERFYQGDSSSTRSADGTGLGLALVKELTELMGGKVSVSSGVGEGSTFRVALPVQK